MNAVPSMSLMVRVLAVHLVHVRLLPVKVDITQVMVSVFRIPIIVQQTMLSAVSPHPVLPVRCRNVFPISGQIKIIVAMVIHVIQIIQPVVYVKMVPIPVQP